LPFARFREIQRAIIKAERDEYRQRLISSAFTAFLISGYDGSFIDYLDKIGLGKLIPREQKDDEAKLAQMGINVKKVKK
jgi:hypothetical protein